MGGDSFLVAGGLGYIGSQLVNHIFATRPQSTVVVFDRVSQHSDLLRISGTARSSPRFRLVIGDTANEKLISRTLEENKVDVVIFAAIQGELNGVSAEAVQLARNNLLGFTHFLESVRFYGKLKRLVFVSSEEVYGCSLAKSETTVLRARGMAAASQSGCEAMLNAYAVSYRLPLVVARLSQIVYGGQMNSDNPVRNAVEGSTNRNGTESCSALYIDDAVAGLLACAERGEAARIYNIGGDYNITYEQLKELISRMKEGKTNSNIGLLPAKMSSENARSQLHWKPEVGIAEGIRRVVDAFTEHSKVLPVRTLAKLLVYGAKTWIGEQFVELLVEKKIDYTIGERVIGTDSDELVLEEILLVSPSHVILLAEDEVEESSIRKANEGAQKLRRNVTKNLYAPWVLASLCDRLCIHFTHLASACSFCPDSEQRSLNTKPCMENIVCGFRGTDRVAVRFFTDRSLAYFSRCLKARVRLPMNSGVDPRNVLLKVIESSCASDEPESVTVLPDCLPVLLDLMLRKHSGAINLVNPDSICLSDIRNMYSQLASANLHLGKTKVKECNFDEHCTVDSTAIRRLYPDLRCASEAVHQAVVELTAELRSLHNETPGFDCGRNEATPLFS